MWLLALFVIVPLIEIALFIQIGGWLTLWPTLSVVVLTAILGTWLVRIQGLRTLSELQAALDRLENPTAPLANGAMILFAGALLLTPGFLTDAIGFALLVPPVRALLLRALLREVKRRARRRQHPHHQPAGMGPRTAPGAARGKGAQSGQVIDASYEEIEPEDDRPGAAGPSDSRRSGRSSGWTRD